MYGLIEERDIKNKSGRNPRGRQSYERVKTEGLRRIQLRLELGEVCLLRPQDTLADVCCMGSGMSHTLFKVTCILLLYKWVSEDLADLARNSTLKIYITIP